MSLFPVQYQDVMLLVVEGHPGQVPGTGFASLVLMHGLVFGIACFSHRLSPFWCHTLPAIVVGAVLFTI